MGGSDPPYTNYWVAYVVTDSWMSSTPIPVLTVVEFTGVHANAPGNAFWPDPSPRLFSKINAARDIYLNLVQGGSSAQMTQWAKQLTDLVSVGPEFGLVAVEGAQTRLDPYYSADAPSTAVDYGHASQLAVQRPGYFGKPTPVCGATSCLGLQYHAELRSENDALCDRL